MAHNVWVDVPLSDYEAHMDSPAVAQLPALVELFAMALSIVRPQSVAVLGIAGGNGLDVLDLRCVTRVVGIDINAEYLATTAARHSDRLPLDLRCLDLSREAVTNIEPVDLVHAALIFEHAGTGPALDAAIQLVAPSGHLSVVLQLPASGDVPAPPSAFASIERVRGESAPVDRDAFVADLRARGFDVVHQHTRAVASGKALWLGVFTRAA